MADEIQTPRSNRTRLLWLNGAKLKNDALGTSSYLSSDTKTKLNGLQSTYKSKMQAVGNAKSDAQLATATSVGTAILLRRKCSRFIQVFVLGVEDGDFLRSDLAKYQLESNGNLPPMGTDAELVTAADNLATGEAARIAAGQTAMANPAIAAVSGLLTTYNSNLSTENTSKDTLKTAQRGVNDLNDQVDDCLRFVVKEVEAHFSDQTPAVRRDEGRLWGFKYTVKGTTKKVTGTVKDSLSGDVITDVDIYFENGINDATSTATGFELSTTLMGDQVLKANHSLYKPFEVTVTLVENSDLVVDIVMVKL